MASHRTNLLAPTSKLVDVSYPWPGESHMRMRTIDFHARNTVEMGSKGCDEFMRSEWNGRRKDAHEHDILGMYVKYPVSSEAYPGV